MKNILFPPEWFPQSAVQLTWPHEGTDWADMLEEVTPCFVHIAREILKRENLIVVCQDAVKVQELLGTENKDRLFLYELPSNDTWARDHGGISVFVDGVPCLYDFTFNAWGMKFPSNLDNQLTFSLYGERAFNPDVEYVNQMPFVLEGGSLESDGEGTLLTTAECLLSVNRNDYLSEEEVEAYLIEQFGLKRVLWLRHGYLAGDDTDSHIDTLARFCDAQTIAYVAPGEEDDEHTEELRLMEEEIRAFRTPDGKPYRLIELPMADPVFDKEERLPATYANFLIMNGAVLLPFYGSPKDELARQKLQQAFPDREIVGINCLPLLHQHGSLHCLTMQFPDGFVPEPPDL
ncbi:MAG: agmatine deiminase family protein [Bacteroidales bacterium]|nr:agmatine deiminase family protein [Bacteroidales bacterium]